MSKQDKKVPQPNYVRKLHYLHRIGAIPRQVGVHHLEISHDQWCAIFAAQPQPCNCDPTIRVKVSLPGNMN